MKRTRLLGARRNHPRLTGLHRPALVGASLLAVAAALTVGVVVSAVMSARPSGISGDGEDDPPTGRAQLVGATVGIRAVGIRAGGCSLVDGLGSGIIVDDGTVLTSAHVVAGSTDLRVVVDGQELSATVDTFDPDADLALLRADVEGAVVRVDSAPVASEVSILAWTPDGGVEPIGSSVGRRLLVTIEDIYLDGRVEREAIELTTGVARGVSGAGVVDDAGHLVGIVYASSRERQASFAIDAPLLRKVITSGDGVASPNGRCL